MDTKSDEPNGCYQAICYLLFGISVFCALLIAIFGKSTNAYAALACGICAIIFSKIESIAEISVSAKSLSVKMREAEELIEKLKRLALLTGENIIRITQTAGVLGGPRAVERDKAYDDTMRIFEDLNVGSDAIDRIRELKRTFDNRDFLWLLHNLIERNIKCDDHRKKAELLTELTNICYRIKPFRLGDLEIFADSNGLLDEVNRDIIRRYRAFLEKGFIEDEIFWRDRDSLLHS